MPLNKDDLCRRVLRDEGFSKARSFRIMESMLEIVKKTLESCDDVLISGFGKFSVKEKNEKRGRNPQTCGSLTLYALRVLVFKYSPLLKKS